MFLPILLLLSQQQTPALKLPAGPPAQPKAEDTRYRKCLDLATHDTAAGVNEAVKWRLEGGAFLARQCLGVAYANQLAWAKAAEEFAGSARDAEMARDARAADFWAQAGNAWLAAGEPAKALTALDSALAGDMLAGLPRGEAYLDRARARVASGDPDGARGDLDAALVDAADDPLAWLLSATLARRTNDLPRAQKDIAEALRRASDDPSVQLEAGNIAALTGDEARARAAWERVVELAPGSAMADSARKALEQFGSSER